MGLSTVAALLCFYQVFQLAVAQREHKVHNIVLYPHKHSWCKTTAIKQVVAHPGCDFIEVENNVCVGGCFSYSIPRTIPSSPGEVAPYCDSCQPSTHTWRQVILNCTSGDYEGELLTKMVQIIEDCTCTKCSDQSSSEYHEEEEEGEEEVSADGQQPEKPQLMDILDPSPHKYGNYTLLTNSNSTQANDTLINQRTLVLLGEISDGGDDVDATNDQVALREILHHVEGEDNKINGVILKDFVRKVEEKGHVNINVERLQKVLERLEHAERKKNAHNHQNLMSGPHHSLIFAKEPEPESPEVYLKPTLDVPSHLLKPAHEGSELSYHNNMLPADDSHHDNHK